MDVRFTANGQRAFSLPGCATLAAIHSVLTTGALVAPGLRIRRMLRQLSGATGTCDVVEPSGAVGSRRCVHGEGWILGGADGSEGFGKAETETRRTRRGCGFPRFCKQNRTAGLLAIMPACARGAQPTRLRSTLASGRRTVGSCSGGVPQRDRPKARSTTHPTQTTVYGCST
jgi:hypothetical protein